MRRSRGGVWDDGASRGSDGDGQADRRVSRLVGRYRAGSRRVRVQLAADVGGDDSYTQENHVVLLEVSEVFETLFR